MYAGTNQGEVCPVKTLGFCSVAQRPWEPISPPSGVSDECGSRLSASLSFSDLGCQVHSEGSFLCECS